MATHAQIGLLRPDGTIKSIFVWYNGYPGFTGRILKDDYKDENKINQLLDLGALLVLGRTTKLNSKGANHPDAEDLECEFCVPMKNAEGADTFESEEDFLDDRIDYNYLFKDGEWLVSEFDRGFEPLSGVISEALTEKKVELDVYDFDQEEYFTPDEQEEYGIDERGEEIDGYETWHHCGWCGEPFPDSELRKEIQFGWLCDHCAGALWSRGEKLALIESAGKETGKDFAEAIVPVVERYIKNLGGENYDEWAEVQLVSDMKKLYNRFFDGTDEHGLITQFIDEIMTDPEGVLKLYKAVLNEELEAGDNILDAVCFIPMTEEGRWSREITPEALKEHRGFIEVDGHRVASFEEFWPDLTFGERYPLAQNHDVVMVGRTPYIKVTGSLINGDDSDRYVDEDLEIEKDGKTFTIKKTDRMAPDSKFDVFCSDKHCGMFDSVEAATRYINDEASKELHENDEPEYLSDKVTQVLDDYGILYGDIVENGDGTVNIVGVDEDEWQEVVDAISAELGLDVLVPDEDHDELDNELIVRESLKESKKDLTTVVKDSYKHMGDLGKENPNLDDIIDDILNNYEGYGEEGASPEKMTAFTSAVKQELNSLGLPFVEFEDEGLKEKIEQQPDTIYKGITIEHFPMEWHYADKTWDQDGYVILSPYYLKSTEDKPKTFLPLFCEDEFGEVLNFKTLDDAKNYIDNYIVPKKGKIKIKAPYGGSDEVHFELLPEYRKEKEDIDEGAQGKKTPGREWIIYKVESPYRIVATRSTYVEAQDFVNRWNRKHEAEEEVTLDDVPLGRFKKGDNYPELYYEDLNEAFTNLVESSWVIKSTVLKDGSHLSVAWEKGQGYYVTCSHDPFKDETGATVYRTKFRDHYNKQEDAIKAYDEIVKKDASEIIEEKLYTNKKSLTESKHEETKFDDIFKASDKKFSKYITKIEDALGAEELYGGSILEIKNIILHNDYNVFNDGVKAEYSFQFDALVDGDFDEDEMKPHWIRYKLFYDGPAYIGYYTEYGPEVEDKDAVVMDSTCYYGNVAIIEMLQEAGYEPVYEGIAALLEDNVKDPYEDVDEGYRKVLKEDFSNRQLPTKDKFHKKDEDEILSFFDIVFNYVNEIQDGALDDIEAIKKEHGENWKKAVMDAAISHALEAIEAGEFIKVKDEPSPTEFRDRIYSFKTYKEVKDYVDEYPELYFDSNGVDSLEVWYDINGEQDLVAIVDQFFDEWHKENYDESLKAPLKEANMSGNWVMLKPEEVEGLPTIEQVQKAYKEKYGRDITVTEIDDYGYNYAFKEQEFRAFTPDIEGREAFWVVVHKDEAPLDEGKELEETVEKHDTLNPKLWNEDKTLKPEVEEKVKEIVNNFVEALKEDEIKIDVDDIILVGSNCSYNYNNQSDLDIHIVANEETFDCPEKHLDKLYSAYRSLFNNKYDINFYGIPVEIYIEPKGNPAAKSNGLYSLNNGWVREPVQEDIPEVNQEEIDKEVQSWLDRADKIIENPSVEEIENFITDIYDLRKSSIEQDGEYGIGNLVFKEIRGAGILDLLKELKADVAAKNMSLGQGEGSNEEETKVDLVTPLEEDFSNMVSEMIYNTTLEKRGGTFDKESGEDLTGSDLLKNKFAVGFLGEDWEQPIEEVEKELFTTTLNNLQSSKEAIEADAIGTWSDDKQSSIDLTKLFSNEDEAREFALLKNQKAIMVFNEFGEYSDTIYLKD